MYVCMYVCMYTYMCVCVRAHARARVCLHMSYIYMSRSAQCVYFQKWKFTSGQVFCISLMKHECVFACLPSIYSFCQNTRITYHNRGGAFTLSPWQAGESKQRHFRHAVTHCLVLSLLLTIEYWFAAIRIHGLKTLLWDDKWDNLSILVDNMN